jgi:hypothetical protein
MKLFRILLLIATYALAQTSIVAHGVDLDIHEEDESQFCSVCITSANTDAIGSSDPHPILRSPTFRNTLISSTKDNSVFVPHSPFLARAPPQHI